MQDIRTRFGRVRNRTPKNTLVTIRKDNTVYFGISRCNLKLDAPNKQEGKRIARQRADIAASEIAGSWDIDGSLYVHKSGVFGQVSASQITKLLSYFDNVDDLMSRRASKGNQ